MLRILHDLIGEAVLDHLTVEHDDGAVRQKPDDAEVVRDDHHRDAEVAAELQDEVEHAGLHREVEPRGDLVQEEHGRLVGEGLGDLHALLHAARERARRVLLAAQRDLDAPEQLLAAVDHLVHVAHPGRDLLLGDVGEAREVHAEAEVGVLVHHAKDAVADVALLLARDRKAVLGAAVERGDAHVALGGILVEVEALHEGGLAGAGLAHDP